MKKYFLTSDIHGCFTELIKALDAAKFDRNDPNHILIGLGDFFDRGEENKSLYKYLLNLKKENRLIYILGNHDYYIYDFVKGDYQSIYFNMEYNGLKQTVKQLTGSANPVEVREQMVKIWDEFFADCPHHYQIGKYFLTHSGINYNKFNGIEKDWKPSCSAETWNHTPAMMFPSVEDFCKEKDIKLIVGHWHATLMRQEAYADLYDIDQSELKSNRTFVYKDYLYCLDSCTNLSKFVNVLIIDEEGNLTA